MVEVEDVAVPVTPVEMGVVDEAAVAVEAAEAVAVEAVEAVAVEAVVETTTTMTTMTTRAAPHPLPSRVFPDVYDYETDDVEATVFSTTPKCNNN